MGYALYWRDVRGGRNRLWLADMTHALSGEAAIRAIASNYDVRLLRSWVR